MDFHNLHCVSWRTAVHRLASALWLLRESYRGAPHLAGLCGQYNEDGFGLPVGGQLRDTALGVEAGAGSEVGGSGRFCSRLNGKRCVRLAHGFRGCHHKEWNCSGGAWGGAGYVGVDPLPVRGVPDGEEQPRPREHPGRGRRRAQ